ncbi:MAG TPA: hypothetical protein VLS53_05755 [Candidatus Dormibacteraeota bacterium]|nr:hypothetical protein [Candidatus Dormibacteraeota bacterium]
MLKLPVAVTVVWAQRCLLPFEDWLTDSRAALIARRGRGVGVGVGAGVGVGVGRGVGRGVGAGVGVGVAGGVGAGLGVGIGVGAGLGVGVGVGVGTTVATGVGLGAGAGDFDCPGCEAAGIAGVTGRFPGLPCGVPVPRLAGGGATTRTGSRARVSEPSRARSLRASAMMLLFNGLV